MTWSFLISVRLVSFVPFVILSCLTTRKHTPWKQQITNGSNVTNATNAQQDSPLYALCLSLVLFEWIRAIRDLHVIRDCSQSQAACIL